MINVEKIIRAQIPILAGSVWLSALLFGLYIIGFYAVSLVVDNPELWNQNLAGLFVRDRPSATYGIGIHFLGGGIILVLGCIQLMTSVREKFPIVHRAVGRVYLLACLLTSLGGLVFIAVNRTIGGLTMDIAFALYGTLMLACTVQTFRYAIQGKIAIHREWAIRLFALAIGSWLYRMGYGFWFMLTDGIGHTKSFAGPFDYFMDFFFFIPNLVVAEMILRGYKLERSSAKWFAAFGLAAAIGYVCLATYFFFTKYWLEGIEMLVEFLF